MPRRNLYLKNTPLEEAVRAYLDRCRQAVSPRTQAVKPHEALGKVTASPVFARISSPSYNAAAMDGIAVRSKQTENASESAPVTLHEGRDYQIVDTGDPVLAPWDAVVMAEDVVDACEGELRLTAPAAPWSNIRPIGEDFAQAEMILPSRHAVRPIDIGLLLSGGITSIEVFSPPRVAVIPTGTELVDPYSADKPCADGLAAGAAGTGGASGAAGAAGSIIDSNSYMIAAQVCAGGGLATRMAIVADDWQALRAAIAQAASTHDIVCVLAGSSAGTEDLAAPILREIGEVLVHGVAIKPGKPVILALVEGTPVIGLPGYPLAAHHDFMAFVKPVMELFGGSQDAPRQTVAATLAKRLVSSLKFQESVQVKVGRVGDRLIAAPLSRGAGIISSLARSDGCLTIPQELEGLEAGEQVEVRLYCGLGKVEGTCMAVGSHDLVMDLIADLMPQLHQGMYLSSTHVGSLAGLNALKRGEAHLAPCHLLDMQTGAYNVAAIHALGFSEPMALIRGFQRKQGLMLAPGNPLRIASVADLRDRAASFVNRQRGAGTRVLFDYLLGISGIAPEQIEGYGREATTHMAVATAVASGTADAGMGVLSAANALGLDFVEVGAEQYDFAIPQRFCGLPQVQAFIATLQCPRLREQMERLGGYGFERSGEVEMLAKR